RDNFVLEAGGTVNALCWWGFYLDFAAEADCGPGGVPDVFTVTYYTNVPGCDNGTPGPIKAGPFDVTATLGKAQTGNLIPSDFGDMVEYGYTATHPSVPVVAGECVWIEVRNDTTGSAPSCIWLWSTAPSAAEGGLGDGVSWQNDNLRDFDLAFCLNEPLGDPTNCNLMIDPGCQGAVNPCDEESPDPGCADACCCSLVCAEPGLAFCCDVVWDAACVEIALELCTNCGELGTGDCFEANFTPYCDDTCGGDAPCFGCCQRVCSADPFCCGDGDPPAWWDGWCAFQATQVCMCQPAQVPVNDDCADAIAIGLGDTPLDNTCASAGGPDHAQCTDGYLAGLGLDIWYTYTANFTGQPAAGLLQRRGRVLRRLVAGRGGRRGGQLLHDPRRQQLPGLVGNRHADPLFGDSGAVRPRRLHSPAGPARGRGVRREHQRRLRQRARSPRLHHGPGRRHRSRHRLGGRELP
ncbi:MAG: hypothetical protein ACYTAQ_12355, partial [Planctomycetota bacterium]